METNLDQKQLLVLGYLRQTLHEANLIDYLLGDDENKTENEIDSPLLTPMSKFDEQMQLFNLGIPQFRARSASIDSLASHLSDHDIIQYGDFTLPINIIQFVYLYFNRYQNYLLLLSGSEECKNNNYNQIQVINLRNVSDIKQKIDYPYTNYRLSLNLWRDKINYKKYFKQSTKKYLTQSKTVTTPQPLLSIITEKKQPETPQPILTNLGITSTSIATESKKNETPQTTITVESPKSPWTSTNSPYSPFALIDNNNNALIPSLQMKPRSKSSSNLTKLGKKDAMKFNKRNAKGKSKTVSMKKRKSAANIKMISSSKNKNKNKNKNKKGTLTPKQLNSMRRHSTNSLISKKGKKSGKNIITDNNEFDRYSFGECIMSISNINGYNCVIPKWSWLKSKYKSEIKRDKDSLEFAKYKMFIRCGGIFTKDDEYTNQNDLILFNATNLNDIGRQIDSYYCKLPSFKHKIEAPAICWDNINNLLSFGGYSYDDGKALKSIYSLNLNVKRNKFKWKKYGCNMNTSRYDSAITHIIDNKGQNKFIIIGGKGSSTKPINNCEMFDSSKTTNKSKCIILQELNFKRFRPGSTQINGKLKIAVAGGILYGKGANKIEIYDLVKNKWIIHSTPLNYDHQHPTIWSEVKEINPNILYVAGNNISFGAKKGSLGYIEYTDLRVKDKKFKLLYDEPIEELYEFWGIRPNIWEPRSLLQFTL